MNLSTAAVHQNCTREAFYNETDVKVNICSARSFSVEEREILDSLTILCGALSLIGSAFIIVTFAVFKKLRVPSMKLVMYLSITDFVSSVIYVLSPIQTHDPDTCEVYPVCYFEAGLSEFAEVASFFWIGCIAFNIYAIAVLRMNERRVNLQHIYYHICSWGIPLILSITGYALDYYGACDTALASVVEVVRFDLYLVLLVQQVLLARGVGLRPVTSWGESCYCTFGSSCSCWSLHTCIAMSRSPSEVSA